MRLLIVPGLGGSEAGHWQRRLLERDPRALWVEQDEWDRPDPDAWTARLHRAVREEACVIAAHSLGCALVARWAPLAPAAMVGALLVSPPDVDSQDRVPPEAGVFAPMPRTLLPFPAIVVASCDDPYMPQDTARDLAVAWGGRFVDAGPSGHINVDSGHGPWPEGDLLLEELAG